MYQGYSDTLDSKYSLIKKYSDQANSTRKFQRGSEDPVGAIQTMKACHDYTMNEQYISNRSQAESFMNTTETYIKQINDVCNTAVEKATEAANGDKNDTDLANYATGMENYRDELLTSLNSTYTGKFVFGGSKDDDPPFKYNDDQNLMVKDYGNKLQGKQDSDGYVKISELTKDDVAKLDQSLVSKIDIGTGKDFDMRTSALDCIISGYGEDGKAKNIYDDFTTAINAKSHVGFSNLIGDIHKTQSSITKVEVNIGERGNKLKQVADALTTKKTNLTSTLAGCYEVDQVGAIMKYNMAQTVYNESLSMASTVLQNSILDFLK